MKADDICKDTAKDAWNYELNSLFLKEKTKDVIGVMKDELYGKIIKEFVALGTKTYSYLIDYGIEDKKSKGTKKCVIKDFKFKEYKNCLEATQTGNKINHLAKNDVDISSLKKDHKEFTKNNKSTLKTQERLKSERHDVFTEEIDKIALSSNNDKNMQSIDLIKCVCNE